jgi:hypothetical protein
MHAENGPRASSWEWWMAQFMGRAANWLYTVGVLGASGSAFYGASMAQVAMGIVSVAVALVALFTIMRVLPTVLREVVFISIAVLVSMLATGWCLRNDVECGDFHDAVMLRMEKAYAISLRLARELTE